jgi:hypothetical protein
MILHPALSLFLRVTPHLILGIILYHLDTISASGGLSFPTGKMYIKLTVASHRITPSISCPPFTGTLIISTLISTVCFLSCITGASCGSLSFQSPLISRHHTTLTSPLPV